MPTGDAIGFLRSAVRRHSGPLYLGIADAVAEAIAQRELIAGDRLPPQRQLAEALEVDLTTVTRAYAVAHRRGLLEGKVGRGTFVRGSSEGAELNSPLSAVVDMTMNLPPQPAPLRRLLQDRLAALISDSDLHTLMAYRTGAGSPRDRAAAAAWLRPLLGEVEPDRILVCAGAQCALTALMTSLCRHGDAILTDALTYPGCRALAAQLGLRLIPVATDGDGLVPDAVAEACRREQPKALYCVPNMQNPTTATLPLTRRERLVELALRHRVPIIEDDAYGQLVTRPLPALTSLDGSAGYYIGTLSKCLSPGVRTAFVVAPDRVGSRRLLDAVRATSLSGSPLLTSLVTRWIEDGTAGSLRQAIRQEAAARQQIAREVLTRGEMAAHPEGLHVWLTLPIAWNRVAFAAHMRQRGLALVASDSFAVATPPPNAVRICTGAAPSRDALRTALQAIAETIGADVSMRLTDIV